MKKKVKFSNHVQIKKSFSALFVRDSCHIPFGKRYKLLTPFKMKNLYKMMKNRTIISYSQANLRFQVHNIFSSFTSASSIPDDLVVVPSDSSVTLPPCR